MKEKTTQGRAFQKEGTASVKDSEMGTCLVPTRNNQSDVQERVLGQRNKFGTLQAIDDI